MDEVKKVRGEQELINQQLRLLEGRWMDKPTKSAGFRSDPQLQNAIGELAANIDDVKKLLQNKSNGATPPFRVKPSYP